jgi:hypothetical protein
MSLWLFFCLWALGKPISSGRAHQILVRASPSSNGVLPRLTISQSGNLNLISPKAPTRPNQTTHAPASHPSRHGHGIPSGEEARARHCPPSSIVPAPCRACHRAFAHGLSFVARGGHLQPRARRRVVGAPGVARGDRRFGEAIRRHHLREGRRRGHRQGVAALPCVV